jgi:hypothetical protein
MTEQASSAEVLALLRRSVRLSSSAADQLPELPQDAEFARAGATAAKVTVASEGAGGRRKEGHATPEDGPSCSSCVAREVKTVTFVQAFETLARIERFVARNGRRAKRLR